MKTTDPPVIVEETYEAPVDEVWKALTEIDRMRQWYFDNIPDFAAEVGFETRFVVSNEGRDFPHRWRVTEVEPGRRIVYDWSFDNYPGDGFVEFELSPLESGTHLKLTNGVREEFPDDVPEFRRESCVGGWQYFLKDRLKSYLESPDP